MGRIIVCIQKGVSNCYNSFEEGIKLLFCMNINAIPFSFLFFSDKKKGIDFNFFPMC